MRNLATTAACAAVLLLTACGSGDDTGVFELEAREGSFSDEGEGDPQASLNFGGPADFPAGFTLYPGAEVISHTGANRGVANRGGGGANEISISSDASPEELLGFYRAEAEGAGFEITAQVVTTGIHLITGEGRGGQVFSFSVGHLSGVIKGQLMVGIGED